MPLEAISSMMSRAVAGRYAVGYFESWNLESLQGVLDAAEETRSPIIIGFNGEFLGRPERLARERLNLYGALGKAAAESASVPVGFIFNECPFDDWVEAAIHAGFNLVMPSDLSGNADEYCRRTKRIVQAAHANGVAVEAELGELPMGGMPGRPTDPAAAAEFVSATGVDLLAVSVGNIHVKLAGEAPLDLDLLKAIRSRTPVPLVLHGGTGIDSGSIREAIAIGVAKVNYGTYLKQRYLAAVGRILGSDERNPHQMLGMGGEHDMMVAARLAVRDAVLERMPQLGCEGRAAP